jgi:hypothetical protein
MEQQECSNLYREFNARNPSLDNKVIDFLCQGLNSERRKVRQGLELLQPKWRPHLHLPKFKSINKTPSI